MRSMLSNCLAAIGRSSGLDDFRLPARTFQVAAHCFLYASSWPSAALRTLAVSASSAHTCACCAVDNSGIERPKTDDHVMMFATKLRVKNCAIRVFLELS